MQDSSNSNKRSKRVVPISIDTGQYSPAKKVSAVVPEYQPLTSGLLQPAGVQKIGGGLRRMASNQGKQTEKLNINIGSNHLQSPQLRPILKSSMIKRSTTDTTVFTKGNKKNAELRPLNPRKESNVQDDGSQNTQRILQEKKVINQMNSGHKNSKDLKKSKDIFRILKLGAFSEAEFQNDDHTKNISDTSNIQAPIKLNHSPDLNKNNYSSQDKSKLSVQKGRKNESVNASLVSRNQAQQIQKKRTFNANLRVTKTNGQDNSLLLNPQTNMLLQSFINSPSKVKQMNKQNKFNRLSTLAVGKKKPKLQQQAMTIEELRNLLLHEVKNKVKDSRMSTKTLNKIKSQDSKVEGDDNDDNISSDDCVDSKFKFAEMDEEEKKEHLQILWRKGYIKARAGVQVLRLFNDLARKIYLFGISKNLNEIEQDEVIAPYILMPQDKFRSTWNIINIFMLLYTILYMPYKIAFEDSNSLTDLSAVFDWLIDALFIIDIFINFFTAFEDYDGTIQHKFPVIVKTYLKGWFIFDVVASFPFQVINGPDGGTTSYQKLLRLLRLPKLYRMIGVMKFLQSLKCLSSNRGYIRFMKYITMNTAVVRMVQGMVTSVILTHLFACFWFLSSRFDDFNPDTWVFRMGIIDMPPSSQYLYSLYWSSQTVITVGYGDIPSVTPSEMILSLFWMTFGVGFYSFIIGNYSSIISSNIQIQASIQMKIKGLAELAKKAQIPLDLLRKIKKFIENNYEAIYNQEDETQLIKMLPPSLRDEVLSNTYGEVIEKITFFKEMKDPDFLWKILPLLRPIKLEKGDILYWRGDHAEDIYFILKGSIKLYTDRGYPYIKYQVGDLFGDSDTLLDLPRDGKAIATTHLKLMVLKIDQLFEKQFENQEKNFMEMILNARKKRNLHLQLIRSANRKAKKQKKGHVIKQKLGGFMGESNNALEYNQQDQDVLEQIESEKLNQQKSSIFTSFKKKIVSTLIGKAGDSNTTTVQMNTPTSQMQIDQKPSIVSQGTRKDKQSVTNLQTNVASAVSSNRHKQLAKNEDNLEKLNKIKTQDTFLAAPFHSKTESASVLGSFKSTLLTHHKKQSSVSIPTEQDNNKEGQISKSVTIKDLKVKTPKNEPSKMNVDIIMQQNTISSQMSQVKLNFKSQNTREAKQVKSNEVKNENETPHTLVKYKSAYNQQNAQNDNELINIIKKKTRLSILDKVLLSAFKNEDLENIYEQFPFLQNMTNDQYQERIRRIQKARSQDNNQVQQEPSNNNSGGNQTTTNQQQNLLQQKSQIMEPVQRQGTTNKSFSRSQTLKSDHKNSHNLALPNQVQNIFIEPITPLLKVKTKLLNSPMLNKPEFTPSRQKTISPTKHHSQGKSLFAKNQTINNRSGEGNADKISNFNGSNSFGSLKDEVNSPSKKGTETETISKNTKSPNYMNVPKILISGKDVKQVEEDQQKNYKINDNYTFSTQMKFVQQTVGILSPDLEMQLKEAPNKSTLLIPGRQVGSFTPTVAARRNDLNQATLDQNSKLQKKQSEEMDASKKQRTGSK